MANIKVFSQPDIRLDRIYEELEEDNPQYTAIENSILVISRGNSGLSLYQIDEELNLTILDSNRDQFISKIYFKNNMVIGSSFGEHPVFSTINNDLSQINSIGDDNNNLREPLILGDRLLYPDYWSQSLRVYSVEDWDEIAEVINLEVMMYPSKICVDSGEELLYLAGSSRGNPEYTSLICMQNNDNYDQLWSWNIAEFDIDNNIVDFFVTDTLLCAVANNEVSFLKLNGDQIPQMIGRLEEQEFIARNRVVYSDNYFVTFNSMTAVLELYDIINPYIPRLVGRLNGFSFKDISFYSKSYFYATILGENNIYSFDCSHAMQESQIPINNNRFELISFCREPSFETVDSLFANWEGLQIVATDNGQYFIPGLVNTLNGIDISKGYRVFTTSPDTVRLRKPEISEDQLYHIEANRWNWIGYPYTSPTTIEHGLDWVYEEIAIIMNDDGQICIPYVVDNLDQFTPGEGYFVFSYFDLEFEFQPPLDDELQNNPTPNQPEENSEVASQSGVSPTGLPYAVLVTLSQSLRDLNPEIIEVYDGEQLVGSAKYSGDQTTAVIAWQGSEEYGLPGYKQGHPIWVKVLNDKGEVVGRKVSVFENAGLETGTPNVAPDGNLPVNVSFRSSTFGTNPYAEITIDAVENEKVDYPTLFTIGNPCPNPFNASSVIPVTLPETGIVSIQVFNLMGQEVFNYSGNTPLEIIESSLILDFLMIIW
ncbi:T9SS type A sorting domain-containing protein [bacterium]|nr:T9SS type A sorting domain-containing protein [bacterium]